MQMSEETQEKIRSRIWTFQLYTDNQKHNQILEYIKRNYVYAYIIHNKDITEDGEIKKEHIHLILFLENARDLKSIVEEFKIEKNLVEKVKSKRYMIRYLTHEDQTEKAQYNKKDIITNNESEILKAYKTEDEEQQISKILTYIITKKRTVNFTEITDFAIQEGYYKTMRKGIWIIKNILEEHNNLHKTSKEHFKKEKREV